MTVNCQIGSAFTLTAAAAAAALLVVAVAEAAVVASFACVRASGVSVSAQPIGTIRASAFLLAGPIACPLFKSLDGGLPTPSTCVGLLRPPASAPLARARATSPCTNSPPSWGLFWYFGKAWTTIPHEEMRRLKTS